MIAVQINCIKRTLPSLSKCAKYISVELIRSIYCSRFEVGVVNCIKKVWTHEQGSVPPHSSLLSGLKALYLLHFALERG